MRYVILFDGVCNFCNYWVKFVYKRDPRAVFGFQPIQTQRGAAILEKYKHLKPPTGLSSVLLLDEQAESGRGRVYSHADAVANITRHLSPPWPIFFYIRKCIPTKIANFLYVEFASRRYRLFGKSDVCIYLPDLKNRFVEWNSPPLPNDSIKSE